MRTTFKAQYPTFGTKNNRQSLSYQQRSPYYWWWEFLRRNEQYLECCRNGGQGDLADLYQSFGDVLHDTFKDWWMKDRRGYHLFAEKPLPQKMTRITSSGDWNPDWTTNEVMVVVVPMTVSKRALQSTFAAMLKKVHKGQRGRKALSDKDASTAKFPLYRNVSIHTLRKQLAVYDAVIENNKAHKKKTSAQLGADLRLVTEAMPKSSDTIDESAKKRNVMTATVSRYFKAAEIIVANTAKGQFPNSKP